jgi:hypothetical protein
MAMTLESPIITYRLSGGEIMKKVISTILFITTLCIISALAQDNAKLVGAWDMSLETPQGTRNFPLVVKEEGGKLVPSAPFTSAEVKGSDVKMSMTVKVNDMDMVITYTGKVEGDAMKGDADFGGFAQGTWSAKRKSTTAPAPTAAAPAAGAVNVTGTWSATVETSQGTGNPTFTFKQEGETLTGNYKGQLGEAPLKGTVKGSDISFMMKLNVQGQDFEITYTGKVEGSSMKGKAVLGQLGEATWTAKKN